MTPFDPSKHLCECGCGEPVNRRADGTLSRFRAGHATRLRSQSGPNHPNWKGGVAPRYYRRVARDAHGDACQRCGATEDILTHHIDRDHSNSDPSNLERLCRTCHMKEHHGKRVEWTCPSCGSTLSVIPFDAARRRYCSRQCKEGSRDEFGRYA